jgi:predicted aminopeptidase
MRYLLSSWNLWGFQNYRNVNHSLKICSGFGNFPMARISARSTAEKRRQQGKEVWISGVSESRANLTLFLEGLLPIRLRRRNKNSASASPPDF